MGGMVAGGIFFLVWLLFTAGSVVFAVLFLVAVWKGMRAHQSIAETLRKVQEDLTRKGIL